MYVIRKPTFIFLIFSLFFSGFSFGGDDKGDSNGEINDFSSNTSEGEIAEADSSSSTNTNKDTIVTTDYSSEFDPSTAVYIEIDNDHFVATSGNRHNSAGLSSYFDIRALKWEEASTAKKVARLTRVKQSVQDAWSRIRNSDSQSSTDSGIDLEAESNNPSDNGAPPENATYKKFEVIEKPVGCIFSDSHKYETSDNKHPAKIAASGNTMMVYYRRHELCIWSLKKDDRKVSVNKSLSFEQPTTQDVTAMSICGDHAVIAQVMDEGSLITAFKRGEDDGWNQKATMSLGVTGVFTTAHFIFGSESLVSEALSPQLAEMSISDTDAKKNTTSGIKDNDDASSETGNNQSDIPDVLLKEDQPTHLALGSKEIIMVFTLEDGQFKQNPPPATWRPENDDSDIISCSSANGYLVVGLQKSKGKNKYSVEVLKKDSDSPSWVSCASHSMKHPVTVMTCIPYVKAKYKNSIRILIGSDKGGKVRTLTFNGDTERPTINKGKECDFSPPKLSPNNAAGSSIKAIVSAGSSSPLPTMIGVRKPGGSCIALTHFVPVEAQ